MISVPEVAFGSTLAQGRSLSSFADNCADQNYPLTFAAVAISRCPVGARAVGTCETN